MRKAFLSVLAASLVVGSTLQLATAAPRHAYKSNCARISASQQFRNAHAFLPSPSVVPQGSPDYSEGYMASGPAGH